MKKQIILVSLLILAIAVIFAGCGNQGSGGQGPKADFSILAGSESKSLEPIIQRFASQNHIQIKMNYIGSVDMMSKLENGDVEEDAVWPPSSLWLRLGEENAPKKVLKLEKSIMRSPVVFCIKKSVADRLGWSKPGRKVTVEEILNAASNGKIRYIMTSATQSNSGAMAYFGYLYAFAGKPEMLTEKNLSDPKVRDKIKRILHTVNRSSGSSGYAKDLFLSHYDSYDGMVNYECLGIEANQDLESRHLEPLYLVYPIDADSIADFPLAYIDKGVTKKEEIFKKLQDYLVSDSIRTEIENAGRRVHGMDISKASKTVFNPAWGIDPNREFNPIPLPSAKVIREALNLYQSAFRKPSITVYVIDSSGSMGQNGGEEGVKDAMRILLDQNKARKYLLQATPNDESVVITFNSVVTHTWKAKGNGAEMAALLEKVNGNVSDGSTNIYGAVVEAYHTLEKMGGLETHLCSIILLTDGQNTTASKLSDISDFLDNNRGMRNVPVLTIPFGKDADPKSLEKIADLTGGKALSSTTDLVKAFKEARGYN